MLTVAHSEHSGNSRMLDTALGSDLVAKPCKAKDHSSWRVDRSAEEDRGSEHPSASSCVPPIHFSDGVITFQEYWLQEGLGSKHVIPVVDEIRDPTASPQTKSPPDAWPRTGAVGSLRSISFGAPKDLWAVSWQHGDRQDRFCVNTCWLAPLLLHGKLLHLVGKCLVRNCPDKPDLKPKDALGVCLPLSGTLDEQIVG